MFLVLLSGLVIIMFVEKPYPVFTLMYGMHERVESLHHPFTCPCSLLLSLTTHPNFDFIHVVL